MNVDAIIGHYYYWGYAALVMIGLYTVATHRDLIRKIIGLNVFQSGAFLFYLSMGKVAGGTAPIVPDNAAPDEVLFSNPLPQALILTAIVVSLATTALALALIVRIKESYGVILEDAIRTLDADDPDAASARKT